MATSEVIAYVSASPIAGVMKLYLVSFFLHEEKNMVVYDEKNMVGGWETLLRGFPKFSDKERKQ